MSLYEDLKFRGLIKQVTDESLAKILDETPVTVYAGFDPTADSLHIGHLLPLFTLARFQRAGHRALAIAGGATGMIGDPSFKGSERQLLTEEQISKNVKGIKEVMARFLDLSDYKKGALLNNGDWFAKLGYVGFLRDVGKHFTVNHMVAKESVRARLEDREHGISYTEFSYMLLQAYDFYHLFQTEGCTLQIGGSDQWGNITAGIELIRRKSEHDSTAPEKAPKVFGLTLPLVLKSDGTKFGKTEGGAIWLSPDKTSPYQLYQFLLQTPDSEVSMMLKFFTFLSHDEIRDLEESIKLEPHKRLAQKRLAQTLTELVHGKSEAALAESASAALFQSDLKKLSEKDLLETLKEAPSLPLPLSALESLSLVDALVQTKLCNSKGMARKDIESGGIYINGDRVTEVPLLLSESHLLHGKFIALRKGKKNYALIVFS